jgi:hypothetical protein
MLVNSEQLEQATPLTPLVPRRALPHDTGEALQRDERLAHVCPVLELFDGNMIAGFATGTVLK